MTTRSLLPFLGRKGLSVKREEENPFALLRREMDELFDSFYRGFDMEPFFDGHRQVFSPTMDVSEDDKEIRVTAELPGMDEKDIEISLNNDTLSIKGEKKEEKEEKGRDYYRMERSYGSFHRTIPLPREVDSDKVDAQFKKGVLTITLPKTKKAVEDTKKIAVKAE
jgi:HSP20 family protein